MLIYMYINSYIHELPIYLCLGGFISGFETSLWLITDGTNCICAYLQQLQSVFVSSSYSVRDGLLDGDAFFKVIHDIATLHPFSNFINSVVQYECSVLNNVAHY